jgi:hypothetical protein
VIFTAAHGYWYLGGTIGLGDAPSPLPGTPTTSGGWVFTILVALMFVAGLVVPITLLRRPLGGRYERLLFALMWIGALVLIVRGGSGLVDDGVRQTGISGGGITGLSYRDTLGTTHPSTYALASTDAIDAYFLLGGILFSQAARRRKSGS